MKNTKKLTVSAITVALGVVFMLLGAVYEPLDLTVSCLASVLVAFIYIEVGSPYTYLVWLCTTLITALIFPLGTAWVSYFLVFGIYPVIKGYIEKLKRPAWLPLKMLFASVTMTSLFLFTTFVMGIESETFFGLSVEISLLILGAIAVLCFLLYDRFLTACVRVYHLKIRPKLKNLLK